MSWKFIMKAYGEISLILRSSKKTRAISISDLAKNIDNEFLNKLITCISEVNSIIETTSALPGYEGNAKEVREARKQIDQSIMSRLNNISDVKENILLRLLNIGIKNQRAGNCYEFSFFGQSLLEKEGVLTEIFRIKGDNTKDSHVFIVANRNQETDASDFNTWNKDAIVVDTYMKQIYFANEIPIYLESCLYNEETSKVKYIPFNSNKHALDNNVRKELVEDWQNILDLLKSRETNLFTEEISAIKTNSAYLVRIEP